MGIDIRRGFQVEWISWGRCLGACGEVMARRGEGGIIRYTFGLEARGIAGLRLPANERRRVYFLLFTSASGERRNVDFSLRDRRGVTLAKGRAILLPLPRSSS